jgi:hypothetical protein
LPALQRFAPSCLISSASNAVPGDRLGIGIATGVHAHTTASDGADTLEAMAEASLAHGYQYIGITDHSKTAHYAGGLTIEEIEQQHAEIDRLNAAFGGRFRIFKGIESDILPDGASTIRTTCCAASISLSAASTDSSASIGRRRPNASCAQLPTLLLVLARGITRGPSAARAPENR